jgi:hypothetical protein
VVVYHWDNNDLRLRYNAIEQCRSNGGNSELAVRNTWMRIEQFVGGDWLGLTARVRSFRPIYRLEGSEYMVPADLNSFKPLKRVCFVDSAVG